jgi:hypothetical protein
MEIEYKFSSALKLAAKYLGGGLIIIDYIVELVHEIWIRLVI